MPDKETLETLAPVAAQLAAEEEQKQSSGTSVGDGVDVAVDVLDIGGTALEGISQVGSAVAENAGGVAEAAVEVVGTVIGGLLDL